LQEEKGDRNIQPVGIKYVMQTREKLKWGTFARFVQWHVTGVLGLRNITLKITGRH
jgi:hypothetical protein